MKTRKSEEKDDEKCFGDYTGWYLWTPSSRNIEAARYLGIPSVYCVGQFPGKTRNPEVVFVQPNRNIDQRTGKVNYLVVEDFEDMCNVVDILKRPYNEKETLEGEREIERDTELARQGRL